MALNLILTKNPELNLVPEPDPYIKGTVRVISSKSAWKDGNARFTTVPFESFVLLSIN